MDNIEDVTNKFAPLFNSEAWEKAEENAQKDKEQWAQLSSLQLYKDRFYRAIYESKFDTANIQNFEAVVNIISEFMRFKQCSRWIDEQATRDKYKPPARPGVGLIFMGQAGTGKTMLAEIIRKLTEIKLYRIIDVAQTFQSHGLEAVKNEFSAIFSGDVIIDDFGIQGERRHFGDGFSIEDIVHQRYDIWKSKDYSKLTIITTNYVSFSNNPEKNISGMCNDFSDQAMTRIKEMFFPVMFRGDCKREIAIKRFAQYSNADYIG